MPEEEPLVGIFGLNDTAEMLYHVVSADFPTVEKRLHSFDDQDGFLIFLNRHKPDVLVFDIPIPYNRNWELVHKLIELKESAGRGIVLTSTNHELLERISKASPTLQFVSMPFAIKDLTEAIKRSFDFFSH